MTMKQFLIDENKCTLSEALAANADDEVVVEWLTTAEVGSTFLGCAGVVIGRRLEDSE
jgi:hypothetical protein